MPPTVITPPRDHDEKVERLKAVLAAIEANPQHWDQEQWHCGTSHCFAGFAQLLARDLPFDRQPLICNHGGDDGTELGIISDSGLFLNTARDAEVWLGMKFHYWDDNMDCHNDSEELFHPENTLADLRRIVSAIAAEGE